MRTYIPNRAANRDATGPREHKMARLINNVLHITFPYHAQTVSQIKTLPNRRWNPDKKFWTAMLSLDSVDQLKAWGFVFNPALREWHESMRGGAKVDLSAINNLKLDLFPFQRDGVKYLESRRGRGLIGDEMGLGKTIQALAWMKLHPEARPAVIIVPASLKLNWAREARKWLDKPEIQILSGRQEFDSIWSEDIVIVNYDLLILQMYGPFDKTFINRYMEDFSEENFIPFPILADYIRLMVKPKITIVDECHYIANPKAQRTKAVQTIGKNTRHLIALSGTPVTSRPVQFFPIISLVNPNLFPSFWHYAQKYCGATYNGFGWDFKGATETQELHEKLTSTIMIRRLKKNVLKDLPDKLRSVVPLEISNRKEYDRAEEDFIDWLREQGEDEKADKASRAETLVKAEALRQLAAKGKMQALKGWLEDFFEQDDKLILFAVHKKMLNDLERIREFTSVRIDGSTSTVKRQEAVDAFQNNWNIGLFLGNIKAAGVGITLTAASHVAFAELSWTPGEMMQAEDRAHRIGQKDTVNVYYLIAEGTIEEEMATILDTKTKVLSEVLDGKKMEDASLLKTLIDRYRR